MHYSPIQLALVPGFVLFERVWLSPLFLVSLPYSLSILSPCQSLSLPQFTSLICLAFYFTFPPVFSLASPFPFHLLSHLCFPSHLHFPLVFVPHPLSCSVPLAYPFSTTPFSHMLSAVCFSPAFRQCCFVLYPPPPFPHCLLVLLCVVNLEVISSAKR